MLDAFLHHEEARWARGDLAAIMVASWNLMPGRDPLRVAKEHGHRISTMFAVYAAWIEGAVEADIGAIRDAMNRTGGELREATARTAAANSSVYPDNRPKIAGGAQPLGPLNLRPRSAIADRRGLP